MDPVDNPYAPGAGTEPPELAGRDEILNRARTTLARAHRGRSAKSFMLIGLRGVGKTVLLRRIMNMAEQYNYLASLIEVPENRSLPELLVPAFRRILLRLDTRYRVNEAAKRGLAILKSFAQALKVKVGELEFELDIPPEPGLGDSGNVESDVPDVLEAVGNAAKERGQTILFVIDELQYIKAKEFSALIMGMHRISQQRLPIILVGAGLPQLVGLAGKSKSYAERLFDYPRVGALSIEAARLALIEPARRQNVDFDAEAVQLITDKTQGYPYFLQEWGYHSWNIAQRSPISLADVEEATKLALESLDESFFRVRFDRLTPKEKEYLFAMAALGEGSHRASEIAARLNATVGRIAPVRSSVIRKGMVYSPAHGDTAFTVPLFDQYLNRISRADGTQ